jgi:hypothetical protein
VYYEKNGAPLCEFHYYEAESNLCDVCKKPIIGRCVVALEKVHIHLRARSSILPISLAHFARRHWTPQALDSRKGVKNHIAALVL